jgi:hypothetical protein
LDVLIILHRLDIREELYNFKSRGRLLDFLAGGGGLALSAIQDIIAKDVKLRGTNEPVIIGIFDGYIKLVAQKAPQASGFSIATTHLCLRTDSVALYNARKSCVKSNSLQVKIKEKRGEKSLHNERSRRGIIRLRASSDTSDPIAW